MRSKRRSPRSVIGPDRAAAAMAFKRLSVNPRMSSEIFPVRCHLSFGTALPRQITRRAVRQYLVFNCPVAGIGWLQMDGAPDRSFCFTHSLKLTEGQRQVPPTRRRIRENLNG